MKLRSEALELLDRIAWLGGAMLEPTLPNLLGLKPRSRLFSRLVENELVRRNDDEAGDWAGRLTSDGMLESIGGRNPADGWDAAWDGNWRLLLFDFPPTAQGSEWRCTAGFETIGWGAFSEASGFGRMKWMTCGPGFGRDCPTREICFSSREHPRDSKKWRLSG